MPSKENTYKSGSIGTENKKTVNSFRKQLRHEQWKSTPATISSEKLPIISRLQDDKSYTSVDEETPISEILWNILVGNPLNLMLIFAPFGIFGNYADWSSSTVFVLNALALVPLSALLGDFTEEVAVHTNPTVGGLINATFGNAFEVVVSIQALLADEYRIVQASVLGSVLSNLLLVLGCSIFFGGLKHKEQSFNSVVTTANMGLLGLCAAAFVLPTPFAKYYDTDEETALLISRIASVALMFIYCQLLLFQLVTHSDLLDDDDDDEEPEMPFSVSMACLAVITLVITELSDYMVSSIDGFCSESGLSRTFVGIIILPIVGNAVEHFTAVSVAMGGKMDLAMGICIGSSIQISILVAPLSVVVGWYVDRPQTLNYPPFEVILFILSVMVVAMCLSNGKTNWLEGSVMATLYFMIAVGFYFEKLVPYDGSAQDEL